MKYYKHPAYIGYANELPKKDDRHKDFEKQYNERGFDDSVTWSLDDMLIRWSAPRLERLIEIDKEIIDEPELIKNLETMLEGFQLYLSDDFDEFNKKHMKKLDKSFKLLAENYRGMWW